MKLMLLVRNILLLVTVKVVISVCSSLFCKKLHIVSLQNKNGKKYMQQKWEIWQLDTEAEPSLIATRYVSPTLSCLLLDHQLHI